MDNNVRGLGLCSNSVHCLSRPMTTSLFRFSTLILRTYLKDYFGALYLCVGSEDRGPVNGTDSIDWVNQQ